MSARWRVAVHEAGHVVAAVAIGLPIDRASILHCDQPDGLAGHVRFDGVVPSMVSLAGAAAEIALIGAAWAPGLQGDRASVEAEVRPAWAQAYRTIRANRAAVEAIARALVQYDVLTPVALYEDILPPFFPEAHHPRLCRFEPSYPEMAARCVVDAEAPAA